MESIDSLLPDPPQFTEEEVEECHRTGRFEPILFEWYKFVAALVTVVSHIQIESPALRQIPHIHYHILIGLLNRCTRLMFANIALSHEGKFGETTAIIDRCIFETSSIIAWLLENPSDERFKRYLAHGLKTEIEFREKIEANIADRGFTQIIEERMLRSIDRTFLAAKITEKEVKWSKKLPDIASMIDSCELDRLSYVVGQKIGSHHVHGTWPSLLSCYLEKRKDCTDLRFAPRGHNVGTNVNQYMFTSGIVLRALSSYIIYMMEPNDAILFTNIFVDVEEEMFSYFTMTVGNDGDDINLSPAS